MAPRLGRVRYALPPLLLQNTDHHRPLFYASTKANMLHMYRGSVRLSFWTENASSTDARVTTAPYRTTYGRDEQVKRAKYFLRRTEKLSVKPQICSSQAQSTTDTAKAALPSIVFGVFVDHRW